MGSYRRSIAIEVNASRLARINRLHFWTFTCPDAVFSVDEIYRRWNRFRTSLRDAGHNLRALRIFEMHPGGHGIHIHFVTPKFHDIRLFLKLAKRAGFGRINVKVWEGTAGGVAGYVGKYMRKAKREEIFEGRRLYGTCGMGQDACRQKDITITSAYSVFYQALAASVDGFARLPFEARQSLVRAAHEAWLRSEAERPNEWAARYLVSLPTKKETGGLGNRTDELIAYENFLDRLRIARLAYQQAREMARREAWRLYNEKAAAKIAARAKTQ